MESILQGLAASFGNNILFALPIAVTLFGEEATLPMVAIIVLALNYQVRTDAIAPAILLSTLGSLVSLAIVASWELVRQDESQ
tara:strand:+ start:461 stop:709 length:249 start_codon:yes stop_codon:yes gene_type:complete